MIRHTCRYCGAANNHRYKGTCPQCDGGFEYGVNDKAKRHRILQAMYEIDALSAQQISISNQIKDLETLITTLKGSL